MNRLLLGMALATALLFSSHPAVAGSGDIVLTIDGNVSGGKTVDMTIAELEALGLRTITTTTPWSQRKVVYEGVLLSRLMDAVGANGEKVSILALNDYRTAIPMGDFDQFGIILATRKNGVLMPVNDKGPLFVVYPFDDRPELRSELYYARSAWQVRSMTVE